MIILSLFLLVFSRKNFIAKFTSKFSLDTLTSINTDNNISYLVSKYNYINPNVLYNRANYIDI